MQVSPRVNSMLLKNYIGRPVRVVGEVLSYDDAKTQMQIKASDGGEKYTTQQQQEEDRIG